MSRARTFQPRLVPAAAFAVLAATPSLALAHHPTATAAAPRRQGVATENRTQVAIDLSSTEVDTPGADGQFVTAALDVSVALGGGFAVRVNVPVHTVDASGFEPATGVGDSSAGLAWRRAFGDAWSIAGGADLLLPTGEADAGLGYGAVGVASAAQLERRLGEAWSVVATAGAVVNVSGAARSIVVEQRADVELRTGVGAGWTGERLAARLDLLAAVPLSSSSVRGRAFFTAQPFVETAAGPVWLRAFGELPLRATRRIDWRVGLGVAYRWDSPSPSPSPQASRVARAEP